MSDIVERAKAAHARRWEQPGGVYPQSAPSAVVELGDWASEYLPELVAEVERLRRSEWAARGERDSMKRRLELLSADESWWVGGVWGHYGEVVVPVRAIAMVLGEKMVDQKKPGEPEIDPGLAATYRDLRATVEHLASENERLQAALSEAKP